MQYTQLGELDLRGVTGLETIRHLGPSLISITTWLLSGGELPEVFVRGTGVPTAFLPCARWLFTP